MTIDYRNGVSILQLIVYLPYLFSCIYVCWRHGFRKNSGWVFLVIFCTLRIVGACAQLATINSTSTTPYTVAAVTDSIGLSPLLLASLGLLSRAFYSILKAPYNMFFSLIVLRVPQVLTSVGLILCIVAATSANNVADIASQTTLHIGIILFLAAFTILVLLTVSAAFARRSAGRGETVLIVAVACSLPFILVRLLYAVVATFGHDSSFNIVTGSVTISLVMAVLEEMVVVAIYTITGLKLDVVPKDDLSPNAGQNMMYRAGRGDFDTSRFGLLSLLIAAVKAIGDIGKAAPTEEEKIQQQKTGMDNV